MVSILDQDSVHATRAARLALYAGLQQIQVLLSSDIVARPKKRQNRTTNASDSRVWCLESEEIFQFRRSRPIVKKGGGADVGSKTSVWKSQELIPMSVSYKASRLREQLLIRFLGAGPKPSGCRDQPDDALTVLFVLLSANFRPAGALPPYFYALEPSLPPPLAPAPY